MLKFEFEKLIINEVVVHMGGSGDIGIIGKRLDWNFARDYGYICAHSNRQSNICVRRAIQIGKFTVQARVSAKSKIRD